MALWVTSLDVVVATITTISDRLLFMGSMASEAAAAALVLLLVKVASALGSLGLELRDVNK